MSGDGWRGRALAPTLASSYAFSLQGSPTPSVSILALISTQLCFRHSGLWDYLVSNSSDLNLLWHQTLMVIHLCHSLAQPFVAVSSSASGVTGGEKHLYKAIKFIKRNICDKCLHPFPWSCNMEGLNASRNLCCYISSHSFNSSTLTTCMV